MRILLDLDDTILFCGKLHSRFDEFMEWVTYKNHEIILWTAHPDSNAFAQLMNVGYINKESELTPEADILIDDCAEQFSKLCKVNKFYTTIGECLSSERKKDFS